MLPSALTLRARLDAAHLGDAAALAAGALAGSGLPPVARWTVPATGRAVAAPAGGGLPAVLADPARAARHDTATLELEDGSLGSLFHPYDRTDWALELDLLVPPGEPGEPGALPRAARALAAAARALLADPRVADATVEWQGPGALCLPELPVAGHRTHAVTATDEAVAAAYARPDDLGRAGWAVERVGERALLTRALDAKDSVSFLHVVQPGQWALARAVRPGLARYLAPVVEPGEAAEYRAAPAALGRPGYDAAAAEVEFSCALKPPAHVAGWEVFEVLALLQAGALDDGRPVRGVRVVFLHPEMAEAEQRPLLDVGARVLGYDADGRLVELS